MKRKTVKIEVIRKAIANYMYSEGCSCCRDIDEHDKSEKEIAELLNVPPYDDDSGYDFTEFRSKK